MMLHAAIFSSGYAAEGQSSTTSSNSPLMHKFMLKQ